MLGGREKEESKPERLLSSEHLEWEGQANWKDKRPWGSWFHFMKLGAEGEEADVTMEHLSCRATDGCSPLHLQPRV